MIARVRGPIEWVMDHRVLYLKRSLADELPFFMLSLYTLRFAHIGGTGHIAFLRHSDGGADDVHVLSDNVALAAQTLQRFAPRPFLARFTALTPRAATFTATPVLEDRWRIESEGLAIDAHWLDLETPVFAYGPSPMRPDVTDTFSVLRPAGGARVAVNGTVVSGIPYPNDVWKGWMGRPLSSCLVAQDEVVVTQERRAAAPS